MSSGLQGLDLPCISCEGAAEIHSVESWPGRVSDAHSSSLSLMRNQPGQQGHLRAGSANEEAAQSHAEMATMFPDPQRFHKASSRT